MNSRHQPTHIHRTFRDLSKDEGSDEHLTSLLIHMGWSGAFGWEKLLESRRVLIISEAGAGKTHECKARQEFLWDQGEPAFYLELASLATNDLHAQLSPEQETRFESWLTAQSDVATFFLDSIDELKLTLGSFETALNRLSKVIYSRLGRVRIVITSRPIPFNQQLIERYFPVPPQLELTASADSFADIATGRQQQATPQEEGAAPIWRNVALMPLSDEQIREMATIAGVDNPGALLADIHARNAENFARRPQDLIELCADWRAHHRIRTHREQVEYDIRVKLKPRTDRREPAQLSPDKAFEGASRLALAALLTRKLTLRFSVEADRIGEPGTSLDPELILADWTEEERQTLLQRALFGFACYGRVRFQQRCVVEYLTAKRLEKLLSQGMPIKALKRLLFAETPQQIKVIRPTLRPIAAWLAASNSSIFSEVRDREPDVLLNHADPESLTPVQRVEALRCYVWRNGQGNWRGLHTPDVQVHRFATPDLADTVLELWQTGIENPEVRELLLDLVSAGSMSSCADIAFDIAANESSTYRERLSAIIALLRLHDSRISTITHSMINDSHLWPDQLVHGAISRLFPHHIDPKHLCEILKRTQASEDATSLFGWMMPSIIVESDLTHDYLKTLQNGITELVTDGLTWEKEWPHLSSIRPHLLTILCAVCSKLIQMKEISEEILRTSVIALRLKCENYDHEKYANHLRETISGLDSDFRELIFWIDDAFRESLHHFDNPRERLFYGMNEGPLDLNNTQDGTWVRRVLASSERSLPERTMMLIILMSRDWADAASHLEHIEGLRKHAADAPALVEQIDEYLMPKEDDPELTKSLEKQRQLREDRKKRDDEGHASWVAFWNMVAENPEAAFSPDRKDNTVWNLWEVMRRSGNKSRSAGWNRRFIEQHFGKPIADQLCLSMRSIWRADRPSLRYERPKSERNMIYTRWQLGLAAIAAEAEDPDWAQKITIQEAELAARYVPLELNGFPVWLESLVREHPIPVEQTLGPELTAEFDDATTPGSSGIFLQNISHAPSTIAKLFLPRLRNWLDAQAWKARDTENETSTVGQLERVLKIFLDHGHDEARTHIHAMAEGLLREQDYSPLTHVWLTVRIILDPASGTDILEKISEPIEPAPSSIATDLVGSLFGERHSNPSIDLRSPGFTPHLLFRLVRLAYTHVRRSDDINHNGSFTPGLRDQAQDGRNALLNAILDSKGMEAWAVKCEMIEDPLFAHFRDRLALLAREKATEEIDSFVFNERDVSILNTYGEAPPTTQEAMFTVLNDRLDEIDDLLLRDDSPREAWALIKDERIMRREIARILRSNSNHLYTVDQEAVTADEKETDIRLRALSGQQATIELKVGENWSGHDLRDTINNQLVEKYMAAESCRSGCLLITVARERNWKHPDTSQMINVDELRTMLETEAAKIVEEQGNSLKIKVKVLDLRPRLVTM